MILSISNQIRVFFLCVGIGLMSGFIYDLFKIIRKTFKHKNLYIQIEDLIYWIVVTFLAFLILLHKNNGEVRLYGMIGLLLGYVINEFLISRWTVLFGTKIVCYLLIMIKQFLKIIMFPIKVMIKILERPLKFVNKKSKNKINVTKNVLKKNKNKLKFKLGRVKRNLKILKDKK